MTSRSVSQKHPTKRAAIASKMEEFIKRSRTTLYPFVEDELALKDPKNMLVHYKRTYEVKNMSDEPIYNILHAIATYVENHSLANLNVHVYDENNHELKISSISVDEPTQKEFTTMFNLPILKCEPRRYYIME